MKLEPTAAFVMAMSADVFAGNDLTRRYMERLDMSSADALVEEHRAVGVYEAAQQVLSNRKFGVQTLVTGMLQQSAVPMQIVSLAAGKSPMGLELLAEQADKVARVFEVDVTPFAGKAALYHELLPLSRDKVVFLEQDILSDRLMPKLLAEGFDPATPTVLLIEGISHYIDHATCKAMLARFVTPAKKVHVILEYSVPLDHVADPVRREKVRQAFAIIEQKFFPQGMTKYTQDWLHGTFKALGGELVQVMRMDEMERLRCGKNMFFLTPESGWIELAVGRI